MARPLPSGKQSVDLATAGAARASNKVAGSKIRRDPPPQVKELEIVDIERRDARTVVFGILFFTLIMVVIAIGLSRVPLQSGQTVNVTARSTKARTCGCNASTSLDKNDF